MALTDDDRELLELQAALSASGATTAGLPSGAAASPEVIRTWELRQAAQREAYGQYVADGDIHLGNTLAFVSGQPVPLEHVIRFNLIEREQVNRVATPEMARLGKRFETDQEFLAANPHIQRRLRNPSAAGELHPSALDPRGGGAAIDDARKAGKEVPEPTSPGDDTEARREAAAEQLTEVTDDDVHQTHDDSAEKDKAAGGKSGTTKTRRSGGTAASDKSKED